jgi:hypothetical protein
MKKIFNYYLSNHYLDLLTFGVVFFLIRHFDLQQYIHISEKTSLYSSLIGLSGTILSLGAMSATLLVSISPNNLFERLLRELGDSLLRNIFKSLGYIFISILFFIALSVKVIQQNNFIESGFFLFAVIYLFSNTMRFGTMLYRILKVRVG